MKQRVFNLFAGASILVVAATATPQSAFAQAAADSPGFELEEIVVTARRKDESIQDVPTTINAVTSDDIQKLNFRDFKEIAAVVPGLTLTGNAQGNGGTATVRGVNYDGNASGNNGTVEFYWNDAPMSAGNLFQAMYDVQQIEVLRGPQGTLRGRASPSGSVTVSTHRADLQEAGGYGSVTASSIGGRNLQGAFGMPVVSDVFAFRVAASYEENEGNGVTSINSSADPKSKTKGARVTLRFEPTDTLSFNFVYQKTKLDSNTFDQVISRQQIIPGTPINAGGSPNISASDRLSVEDTTRNVSNDYDNYNLQAQWAFLGQKLNYVGERNEQTLTGTVPQDIGDVFGPTSPARFQQWLQYTTTAANSTAHELRLSSEERVFGIFDYIVGAFYQAASFPTDFHRTVPLLGSADNLLLVQRRGGNKEQSAFVNLTAHVTDSTEISGGARYIDFRNTGELYANNPAVIGSAPVYNPGAHDDSHFNTVIYSASIKQNISDDLMVYGTFGTSWRPGISVVGDFNNPRTALENSFLTLKPERSKSYELGVKATAFDKRLRTNLSLYQQDFTNFVYRASGAGVYFVDQTRGPGVNSFNFVAGVPARVRGAEFDVAYQLTSDWDLGALGSYSDGKIKNGFVPCNDYSPRDGVPDEISAAPPASVGAISTATGGDVISGCRASYRASPASLWSGTLHSEYRFPINSALNAFARALLSVNGDSKNDPVNPLDDYKRYELLNLYLGVRDPKGVWEASVFGKNVTNTERVLQLSSQLANGGSTSLPSNYYAGSVDAGILMTPAREFGVNIRYNFGSK